VLNRLKTALIARSVAPIAASKARSWEVLTKVTPAVMSVGTPRYIVPTDEFIGPGVWHNGTWDADVHHWALNALGNPHRGRLFVDVGAHVGTTTIPAALDGAYVHAFEPVRTNYALLVANLHLNGLEDNVKTCRAAVTSQAGTLRMALSPTNSGDHRVHSQGDGDYNEATWPTEQVRAVTLDDELDETPAVVWIDTQGHEPDVLDGAQRTIRQAPVVAEFWPYAAARSGRLDRYLEQIASFPRVVDVRASMEARTDVVVTDPRRLVDQYPGPELTDLLLLP
jgi:FkbM family methyltransferase